MTTVLVTIVAATGRADVAAPADAPVEELLETFAQLSGMAGDAGSLEVGRPGTARLAADRTLGEQGVVDGTVLQLRAPAGDPVGEAADPAPMPAAPDALGPVQRTRDALPEWIGLTGRLRAACTHATGAGGRPDRRRWHARVRHGWQATSYKARLEQQIRAGRLTRPVTIAVVSTAAGAGTTTIARLLGSLLARLRVERTVLLDAAPAVIPRPRSLVSVEDLLGMLEHGILATQLDSYLEPATDGLTVLATEPRADAPAYEHLIGRLRDVMGLLIVDCGAGLDDPAARAAMIAADQLVVVVEAGPQSAEHVAVAAAGLRDAAPPAVLVVNRVPAAGQDFGWLELTLPGARGLIAVHDDPRRATKLTAGELSWSHGAGAWDLPLHELAVVLVSDWARVGLAVPARPVP